MKKSQIKRDTKRAADIIDTAEVMGVSTSLVLKTLNQDRKNPTVLEVMMEMKERKREVIEQLKMQYNPNYSSITSFTPSN